ncbi:hypothetical protein F4821DRAFT_249906 [Hypoxylon rubiginosum]|uniref:Uncharacterized protein n=1 Tax=Hypoxylon rubiginosum TaxID=110542 RepID=A0ACC0CL33_9PEZI|nr:hypothetical protein F4821DRAFT_249906 [Hypoxylon rubiginosum]
MPGSFYSSSPYHRRLAIVVIAISHVDLVSLSLLSYSSRLDFLGDRRQGGSQQRRYYTPEIFHTKFQCSLAMLG